jgi:hypothetical protein
MSPADGITPSPAASFHCHPDVAAFDKAAPIYADLVAGLTTRD